MSPVAPGRLFVIFLNTTFAANLLIGIVNDCLDADTVCPVSFPLIANLLPPSAVLRSEVTLFSKSEVFATEEIKFSVLATA